MLYIAMKNIHVGTREQMPEVTLFTQRINQRLEDYWERQRKGKAFPSEGDINPDDLGDVWEHCYLINVIGEGKSFKYSYMGRALIDAYGDDVTNEEVGPHLLRPTRPHLFRQFSQVVKTCAPVMDEGEFVNRQHHHIRYRCCMLPLGRAPHTVSYILGGMKWKAY
jgi:hypothetical protein